jgi:hypothetical protein
VQAFKLVKRQLKAAVRQIKLETPTKVTIRSRVKRLPVAAMEMTTEIRAVLAMPYHVHELVVYRPRRMIIGCEIFGRTQNSKQK